jgi:hypothetical protein
MMLERVFDNRICQKKPYVHYTRDDFLAYEVETIFPQTKTDFKKEKDEIIIKNDQINTFNHRNVISFITVVFSSLSISNSTTYAFCIGVTLEQIITLYIVPHSKNFILQHKLVIDPLFKVQKP